MVARLLTLARIECFSRDHRMRSVFTLFAANISHSRVQLILYFRPTFYLDCVAMQSSLRGRDATRQSVPLTLVNLG